MIAAEKPDILYTIRSEGLELNQRGRNFWACCPFHSERTASFKVDTERQTFYCFGCQEHGDSISFIQKHRGLSFKDALVYLGISISKPSPEAMQARKRQREKAEAVQEFRKWEADYHGELCDRYRCLQNAKDKCRTMADAEDIAEYYHKEPLWIHRMDILEGRDDKEKFSLYREVLKNGN